MKEDEIIFEEIWRVYPKYFKILAFPFKSLCKDSFLVGFNNGVEWTFEQIKKENITWNRLKEKKK